MSAKIKYPGNATLRSGKSANREIGNPGMGGEYLISQNATSNLVTNKDGWEIKKLGEVVDFQNGFAFKSNTYKETGLPILRITNIQNQSLELNDLVYFDTKDYKENLDRFKVFKYDLVVAMSGATTGKLGINTTDTVFYLNQRVGKFIPKKEILKPFLYYFLSTKVEESLIIAAGAAQPNLSTEQINNFEIPLPSLPEQQRIVAILDDVFAAIAQAKANAEQNLKNAKELFESYLQSVFENKGEGWEEKTIGEMCDLMTGGTPSSSKLEYYEGGKIKWLVSGDVNMIEINDCEGRITELGMANSNTKYLPLNSIIIALNGQGKTRGTVAMLRTQATCNQSLVSICPKNIKKIIPDYIFYNLKVRYQEIRKITGDSGNDRRGLNMPLIRSIRISFPESIVEQDKYVKQFSFLLNETKRLEAIYQRKIENLEELKKSILQKAFKGEL
jgi:type I restriction enzyme S subunit